MVASTDRGARWLRQEFNLRRRAEGLAAWPAPQITDWTTFARTAWQDRSTDGRMVLNPAQEQAIWTTIIEREKRLATVLPDPRHRLASLVMQAHALLCGYAPRYLQARAREGWSLDAGTFSAWLAAFESACRSSNVWSASRMALEAIPFLEADATARPPVLAVGFDRMQPTQRAFFTAWGMWQHHQPAVPVQQLDYSFAVSPQEELKACAAWCMQFLEAHPSARVLVISQEVAERRGEIERAFLRHPLAGSAPLFEFSLGIPLSEAALPRAYLLMLRWLHSALEESAIDWLFSMDAAADEDESAALQASMRAIRHAALQCPAWTLESFLRQRHATSLIPAAWAERLMAAREHLLAAVEQDRPPLEWVALLSDLLRMMLPAGGPPLASADYQAVRRWEQMLDTCASLGFNGERLSWQDFLAAVERLMGETLFAPESADAPIQITGPAESAGLTADAIWFLGADEDSWPAKAAAHPLLPLHVQLEADMPHASPLQDWELAQTMTARLLESAPTMRFSYARQQGAIEARPSRVVVKVAGPPKAFAEVHEPLAPLCTIIVQDTAQVPFPAHQALGGSSVLTAQSQCPFKAFATSRLGAQDWQPAEPGLTAAQRGQLLHAVLHAVWGGPPHGLRNLDDLRNLAHVQAFVAGHVRRVVQGKLPESISGRMPKRYLALEQERLTRLVTEWLGYEAQRQPFQVKQTEAPATVTIAGLKLNLRLDRIDRLRDDSLLVIDYKTGAVSTKDWQLPRAQDVQLPLYAGFAIQEPDQLGGLVFAKVRPGESSFAGLVADAASTLLEGLTGAHGLVKNALTPVQLSAWRDNIEQLARDFLAGKASVDPRKYPDTCDACGLQALCRIQEHAMLLSADEETSEDDNA